ncbi:uncharacterized protein NEPG_02595 [Nematocida parisii ERTm1]|uniref:Uncharacterized protein n=1 Tax=Nematocida parisii (strain ERTm3) TaxID=935791 RepID=I3ED71_NEMP3|nr:uncharacterized protein NEPG_02595 [Nematocida parisii ERTm1]EIJ87168.1 hypothetical protein NEQG_02625 [Nematocida parisii ERTm3]EIJ92526.1 hypothetical protein NEPG_02595 [Nematocida parisii ERTm1]|eukprot:XP_013060422.1 hypothetical protein NEPG_02595 [Nematocida parisii ERTm1]
MNSTAGKREDAINYANNMLRTSIQKYDESKMTTNTTERAARKKIKRKKANRRGWARI